MSGKLCQPGSFGSSGLIAGLGGFLLAAQAVADNFQVGQDQLQVDGVNIADGVNAFRLVHILHNMDDVVIVKAAHHMYNGIALADMAQELVSQTSALAGTFDQTGDIHKLHNGGGLFVCLPDLGQFVQPGIRNRNNAGVRLNGAERIVGCLSILGAGQRIEQSGFANIGQTDDT